MPARRPLDPEPSVRGLSTGLEIALARGFLFAVLIVHHGRRRAVHGDDDGGLNWGAVYVLFLNADGTVKSHQKISAAEGNFNEVLANYAGFGTSVSSLGDLDGDGVTDLAVAFPAWGAGKGRVEILSGLDGSTLTVKSSGALTGAFGSSMVNIGDLDGDGKDELLIGAPGVDLGALDAGAAYVYSYATNTFLTTILGTQARSSLTSLRISAFQTSS